MTLKQLATTKDSMIVLSGGTGFGSGTDLHNAVGPEGGNTNRVLIDFETLPTGITNLSYARLYMKRPGGVQNHDQPVLNATLTPERITASWSEGTYGANNDAQYTTTNAVVHPGPAVTGALSARGSQPDVSTWWFIDVTAIVQYWITNGVSTRFGIRLSATQDVLFWSRHHTDASNRPYLELSYNTNSPPDAPTDLTPTGGAVASSTAGTSVTMTARHTDPDGDAATQDTFEVYADTATDAVPGTPLVTVGPTTATTSNNALRSRTATGLPARTYVRWRARFKDASAWGTWSLLQRVLLAYQPGTPTNPAVTPGTLTPDFFASLVSSDASDFITAAEINVYQDPATGQTITKWGSGKTAQSGAPNRVQMTYGGSSLVFGTKYRWQVRLWNRDDVATVWTGNLYFTPLEAVGPVIDPGDQETKQNTRTPTFTLTDPGGAAIDQHRMWFYSPTGTLLYDTGVVSSASTTSKSVVTPAGIWDWGQDPTVAAAIRLTGNANIGPTSDQKRIHINAKPGSPYPLSASGAVIRPDNVYIVTAATPVINLPFRDTDKDLGYVENATRREVEVRTTADVLFGASPYITTTQPISEQFTSPSLTNETTYKFRGRYDDSAGVRSDWSDYLFVKRSAAPTLSSVTPANAATLTDPTPTIAWTYASAGGKPQQYYRLVATVAGAAVFDSGIVGSTANSVSIAADVLPNSSTVSWTLQVWDTDGLSATVSRTFTTNFTQPAALTGLVVTPDADNKALLVSWNASALSAGEFEAYMVYARSGSDPLELVATLTTQASPVYLFRAAPHNEDIQIQVTQTNGWMESDPVATTARLDLTGYWWLRPEPIELRYVGKGAFQAEPITKTEELQPVAGGNKFVLTWGSYGFEWTVRLQLPPDDDDVLATLRADMRAGLVGILKTPRGEAFYSKIKSVPETHSDAEFYDVPVTGTEVGNAGIAF